MKTFEKNVFINCPFDDQYQAILQAVLFCILYLGFEPRVATETIDSADFRLDKIVGLIESSKFSIHDLSRSKSTASDQYYRLNMPFELGIDYACRKYMREGREAKRILILEEVRFQYRAALSDLSGCDVEAHGGNYQVAVRKVRNWLVTEASAERIGAARILAAYEDFQEWHYEKQMADGFSEADIQDYPTNEVLAAMRDWFKKGKPV